jgi:integrase
MAKRRNVMRVCLLTVRQVQTAGEGDHHDGGGLYLRVTARGASWVFRYTALTGKRREMGLGRCERQNAQAAGANLTAARDSAMKARAMLSEVPPVDPIDARERAREEARAAAVQKRETANRDQLTLARACRAYHERVIEPRRTAKHGAEWISSLERLVAPALWRAPAAEITAPALLDFVVELNKRVPETAMRVRQRLETVFDDLVFRGLCASNPAAAIRRKLREFERRRERVPHRALPYPEVPAFVKTLREQSGIAAWALEFALLTAARTGEVIGATWSEIDLDAAVWTVPGSRMKGGEPHVVHLVPRAVEILRQAQKLDEPFVFPSPRRPGQPMSNMAMLVLLKRIKFDDRTTVHGLCRASFSTWANETGTARPDVIEACLAHREGDRIRASYNRSKFNADRRALLEAWASYIDIKRDSAKVVPIKRSVTESTTAA